MKKVRDETENRSAYTNRVQKQKYHTNDEYKNKVKLGYYKKKYKDIREFENIFNNDSITNTEKFKRVKILCAICSV